MERLVTKFSRASKFGNRPLCFLLSNSEVIRVAPALVLYTGPAPPLRLRGFFVHGLLLPVRDHVFVEKLRGLAQGDAVVVENLLRAG